MNIEELLIDVFGSESEEVKTIVECYNVLAKGSATVQGESKVRMFTLDSLRAKLCTIVFMLNRNIHYLEQQYRDDYNKQYTRLAKQGKPNAAIEAELGVTLPDYVVCRERSDSLNQVKDLILSYIRCIDSCKSTAVEVFRNSLRLD